MAAPAHEETGAQAQRVRPANAVPVVKQTQHGRGETASPMRGSVPCPSIKQQPSPQTPLTLLNSQRNPPPSAHPQHPPQPSSLFPSTTPLISPTLVSRSTRAAQAPPPSPPATPRSGTSPPSTVLGTPVSSRNPGPSGARAGRALRQAPPPRTLPQRALQTPRVLPRRTWALGKWPEEREQGRQRGQCARRWWLGGPGGRR